MFDFNAIPNVVFAVGRMGTAGVQLSGTAFSLNKRGYFATASHVAGNDDSGLVLCFKKSECVNIFDTKFFKKYRDPWRPPFLLKDW